MPDKISKLESNQQRILQTLNNGLKSKTEENSERLDKLVDRFNGLIWSLIAGMGTVIMFLITIVWQLSQLGGD